MDTQTEGKIIWNTVTQCEVPYTKRLDVDGNPDLEYRDIETKKKSKKADVIEEVVEVEADATDSERMDKVIAAIKELDPEDVAHYTRGGLPNAVVLSELCGFQVTSDERNEAFKVVKADQA